MNNQGFAELIGLVLGTTGRLFEVARKRGFEIARLSKVCDGVAFEVRWKQCSFVDRAEVRCTETAYRIRTYK